MSALPTVLLIVLFTTSLQAQTADLLVTHATIITMDGQRRVLEDGALVTTGERITAIGPSAQITASYAARKVIDAHGALVMPGLINAHTHLAMSFLRGLAEDRALNDWLQKFIFRRRPAT